MITDIRTVNHQLEKPKFKNPKDVVTWMGAIQGQDYNMAKWAVGIRLKNGRLSDVEEALRKGEILRTHVMRPTWHLVAAEDIRWMQKLTGTRVKAIVESYSANYFEISPELHKQCYDLLGKILEGNNGLTKQEILEKMNQEGLTIDTHQLGHQLAYGEADAFICSGVDKGKKATYALLDERVPFTPELTKEEALARLARNYFQSHSPASLADFVWWSGLPITEARQGIALMEGEIIANGLTAYKRVADKLTIEKQPEQNLYVHSSCPVKPAKSKSIHLLPSFDEYLISYKDRTAALQLDHHPKAFTNNGIFYPVIVSNGKVIGNWKRTLKKNTVKVETSVFEPSYVLDEANLQKAISRYEKFLFE